MRRRSLLGIGLLLLSSTAAEAGDCGGAKQCACGDRLVEDYRLPADLGPCSANGLILRGSVLLDGGGHAVRGSRKSNTWGVMLDERAAGSRVIDLQVTGFERGIRLAGVRGARLERVESHHNGDPKAHKGYGIDVARGASEVVIEEAHVHDNADEGIHVGKDSHDNRIARSRFESNYREDVYFLENEGNRLESSNLRGSPSSSAAAVYIKHARSSRVEGNQIAGRPIMLRGASTGTRLVGNRLSEAGVVLEPYTKGKRGRTVPSDTTIEGGSITFDKTCIRVLEAKTTTIEGVRLDCPSSLAIEGNGVVSAIDTTLGKIECDGDATLRMERRVKARFVDAEKRPVAGAEVRSASGEVLGRSSDDGAFQGTVVLSTRDCDSRDAQDAGHVVVSNGKLRRSLPAAKLSGDVVLMESGAR